MSTNNNHQRRVVITGLGVVSPLGKSAAELWDGLSAGRSGVDRMSQLPPLDGRVVFSGECRDFTGEIDDFGSLEKDQKKSIRKALKVMCRETMMAVASAQQAVADAELTGDQFDPERCGVVFGSDYMLSPPHDFVAGMTRCGAAEGKFDYSRWGDDGLDEMNPLWMLKYLPNMPGSHIAIFNDFRGPNNSLTMREVSGLMAIREAVQTIERGHAEAILAGATGTRVHPFKTVHALQWEQLASPEGDPAAASRPFDANRTGMVLGEGAGTVMLEELESARKRGARIYAEVVGTGSSIVTDSDLKGQHTEALARAAQSALTEAAVSGDQLGHINAHGLSTIRGDVCEADAIGHVLGDLGQRVPVVAAKSSFGNLGAGSGIVELVASVQAMQSGKLFPTLNYDSPDVACPLNVTTSPDVPAGDSFLKLSVTPQAQAAAIVVSRVS